MKAILHIRTIFTSNQKKSIKKDNMMIKHQFYY